MRLTKVKVVPHLIPGPAGLPGRPGRAGRDGEIKVVHEVVEKPISLDQFQKEVSELQKKFDWLKSRRPEVIQGGGQAVTHYIFTDKQETHYRKPSFIEGITVIGVRYLGPATVYLPHDLDPTMIVSVKDEAGSGNITILIE